MVRADKINNKSFQIKLVRAVFLIIFLFVFCLCHERNETSFGENAFVCFVCVRSSLYDSVLE